MIVRVVLPGTNHKGQTSFINFEPPSWCSTLQALVAEHGAMVTGEILVTRRSPEDTDGTLFLIVDRRPYALSKHGVGNLEIPHMRFEEAHR